MKRVSDHPPRWVEKLLNLFLPIELCESVVGDLEEKFFRRIQEGEVLKAHALYMIEGLGLVRLASVKGKSKRYCLNPIDMFKNYFLIAYRTFIREKGYALLNVCGLAVGIASLLTVYVYLRFEYSYDRFHAHADRIYRLTEEFDDDAQRVQSAMTHSPLAEILSENLPGIDHVVRVYPISGFISSAKDIKYRESLFCFADSLFFQMFSFDVIDGSLTNALDKPYSVVLTESMAIKYFGNTDIIGKELLFEDESDAFSYTITSVIKDPPQNSHFAFNFIASFSSLTTYMPWHNNWYHPPMYVYMLAREGTSQEKLQANVSSVISNHQPERVKEEQRNYQVQLLPNIHLYSNLEFEWQANSNLPYLQAFLVIGISILLMAIINFINLTTARASKRAKEIDMRKVFGAARVQLIFQFITETLFYVLSGFAISFLLSELALRNVISEIIDKDLSILELFDVNHLLLSFALVIGITLLAGAYPSFLLAGYQSATGLKGRDPSGGRLEFRTILVAFQFVVSTLMICLTAIISSQMDFFNSKNLGFDKEYVVSVRLSDRFAQKNYQILKESLLAESGVNSVALSSSIPGKGEFHGIEIIPEGSNSDVEVSIKTLGIDEDFLTTYQIPLLEGRDFSKNLITDQTEAFILNKAAATKLGWTDPLGKELELTVYINGPKKRKGKVIGLVDDFNFESLHNKVEPLLLYINKHPYYADFLSVRMQPGNIGSAISIFERNWKVFHPDKPLEFQFLDAGLSGLYNYERKVNQIFMMLTVVAIAVSALGLFGLASFIAGKRMKEMSIRKVFGASVSQLMLLQYRGYLVMFLIATLVALPLSWVLADKWLESFANRIEIGPASFVLPILCSLLILCIATSLQSLNLAKRNPIDIIRSE